MKKKIVITAFLIVTMAASLVAMDPVTIMKKLDQNEVYDTIKADGRMEIHIEGKKYVKTFNMYAKGEDNYFMELTNPDDAGTRYMKKDGNLYVYNDFDQEIIPITGHMLKESMMGSDMSYEDTVSNDSLTDLYDGEILEETTFKGDTKYKGNTCWKLELVAHVPARINVADFEKNVLDKIRSKRKREDMQSTIDEFYTKSGGEYVLKSGLPAEDRIKIHYKLGAAGMVKTAPYGRQLIWVDKNTFMSLHAEMFSASGTSKIKEITLLNMQKFGSRYYPVEMKMRNLLRNDSYTIFGMSNIELDINIPDSQFSFSELER